MEKTDLHGKVVAVTGSSSGIGRAIALELARAGADVAISYHSGKENGEAVAEEIRKMGRRAFCGKLSVGDADSVKSYFEAVTSKLGHVEILVNNAGIDGTTGDVSELDVEDWDKVIAVNLRGPFLCIREVLSDMKSKGFGVILNISSVHEVIPWAGHTVYCATKSALGMMARSMALELQDSGVRVVCLAPGAVRTPINEDVWSDPEKMADLKTKIPMGRIGEAEEIAKVARMLVSSDASYITGTTVTVDGGMTAYPSFAHGG